MRRSSLLPTLVRIAASVLGMLLLCGSSCSVHYSTCTHYGHQHEHPHGCGHHHHHDDSTHAAETDRAYAAVVEAGAEAFRIRRYDAVLEQNGQQGGQGWRLAGLTRIEGPALSSLAPGYAPTPKALRVLGERTLTNNAAVLGLPRGAEPLFEGFEGWLGGQSTHFELEGADDFVLRFDSMGTLVSIEIEHGHPH